MDVLKEHGFDAARCVIDHNNEETVQDVLDRGYWVAFSIYPNTKMGNERMTEIVRRYGPERLIVDSACDWGVSDPLAIPKTALLMAERGIGADAIRKVTYANALAAYGLSGQMREEDWLDPAPVDQRTIYEGNSVLRGGQRPRVEAPARAGNERCSFLSSERQGLVFLPSCKCGHSDLSSDGARQKNTTRPSCGFPAPPH
jgi:hypothetical protein